MKMPTEITFSVPVQLTLWGPTEESLAQELSYRMADFQVKARFRYSIAHTLKKSASENESYADAYAISFSLTPDSDGKWTDKRLRDALTTPDGRQGLVDRLLALANFHIRSLRVHGGVIGLEEFRFRNSKIDSQFRRLKLTIKIGDEIFEPPKGEGLLSLLTDFETGVRANFNLKRSPRVAEALEDGRVPEAEDEFLINAMEFLEKGNLRMAIIESTIALEIAIARFLPGALAW